MTRAGVEIAAIALLAGAFSCGSAAPEITDQPTALIYGSDDRAEYFDVSAGEQQDRMAASMVALVPKAFIHQGRSNFALLAPSWGAAENLCSGTRFADQPAAALCTGVLVDRDLVLTADHCVRVLPLADIAVVFGYYYRAAGVLAIDAIIDIAAIVTEELDSEGTTPRLDYAWLRLRAPAPASHAPAPVYSQAAPFDVGAPLISIGAGGGIPLKFDAGGRIRDTRASAGDYFVADTDTFGGGSGGGAFDAQMNLVGILARGGSDFVATDAGCNAVVQQPDGSSAAEQFTYASQAMEGLCGKDPTASSLCRADCGNPCRATPEAASASSGGCAMAGQVNASGWGWRWVCSFVLFATWATRRSAARRNRTVLGVRNQPRKGVGANPRTGVIDSPERGLQ